jgi:hypothetical protein
MLYALSNSLKILKPDVAHALRAAAAAAAACGTGTQEQHAYAEHGCSYG